MTTNVSRSGWLAGSLIISVSLGGTLRAAEINYDEAKVPAYTVPNPLVLPNGKGIGNSKTWLKKQRPHLLELFETEVYGRSPQRPKKVDFYVSTVDAQALGGKAIRKEVTVALTDEKKGPTIDLLIYFPRNVARPVPAFLGLNFAGNHAVTSEPGVKLSQRWMRSNPQLGITNNLATEASRGSATNRWPLDMILARGYAVVTIYYGDIEPDHPKGWQMGVRGALVKDYEKPFEPDEWGAIAAWAYGLSRALDYLEIDGDIDATRTAVIGHSRLGKTALWAGAQDERFAMVISNDSGCGGAALSRRAFGETVERINTSFPHWFCGNFKKYNGREGDLPVDQHELLALIAPRPLYVASAADDRWADPKGEFLSAKLAEPVYKLFGKNGLGIAGMPPINRSVGDFIGYHIRAGKHDINAFDWAQYLKFADRHLKSRK